MLIELLAELLNEGWEPNWSNGNEPKWYPYFEMGKSGLGFSYSHYDCWGTFASVGSRLAFKTEALAKYAGTQFEDLYKQLLNK